MNTNYSPVKSVLYSLSTVIDERYWNEGVIMEWATSALRQLPIHSKLENKVCKVTVANHKGDLPQDFKYLVQIAYKTHPSTSTDSDGNPSFVNYAPMRMSSSTFHKSICMDERIFICPECAHSFLISPSLVITTSLKDGDLLVSYLAYPSDEDGTPLIPDDETIKEAILNYVLYKYWLTKYQMKEEGADSRMQFHLQMWSTLSKKAANIDLPDISQLENIKNNSNRLVARQNAFSQFFAHLNSRENVEF